MVDRFDVIIVGARCAGSPLAILLARAGLRVCVVDRARFPSDTASTHAIQPSGVGILDRLGVLEPLLKVTPLPRRVLRSPQSWPTGPSSRPPWPARGVSGRFD